MLQINCNEITVSKLYHVEYNKLYSCKKLHGELNMEEVNFEYHSVVVSTNHRNYTACSQQAHGSDMEVCPGVRR